MIAGRGAGGRSGLRPSPQLIDRLYRAARAMCGSADADDLVQETFAQVLARPRAFRAGDPLPYLMRALRNTYLTSLRTAGRRPRTVALATDEGSTMQSSLAQPDAALEERMTFEAIAALSDDFRAVLVAVDISASPTVRRRPPSTPERPRSPADCSVPAGEFPACSATRDRTGTTARLDPLRRGDRVA